MDIWIVLIFGYVSWILNHANVLVLFIQNKYTRLKINQNVTSFKETSLISQSRIAPTIWAHCWICPPPSTRIWVSSEQGLCLPCSPLWVVSRFSRVWLSEIPWTEEPGELPSIGLQRVGQDLAPNNDDNVEKLWKHWAKWKKPAMKGHRFHDSIFMKWPKYASL